MLPLLHNLLKIPEREVEFARRGFRCADPQLQARLEHVGRMFLRGYHAALREDDQPALAAHLDETGLDHRGFAYEGAAMALTLRDELGFRRDGLARFLQGAGRRHVFMLYVGAGWAYARLPWRRRRMERTIACFDPVLRWLVLDGFGFHEGYFHGQNPGRIASSFQRLSPEARHLFYQGLGRSLWFSLGAGLREISSYILTLPPLYQEDAWSGVGLACAYAGGISAEAIAVLRRQSGGSAAALAQGAAFAAKARLLAGNPAAHTETACSVLCGMTTKDAAALCDETLVKVDKLHSSPYQQWRRLVQEGISLYYAPVPKTGTALFY